MTKIVRPGVTGTPTITAPPVAFTDPVKYSDGVRLVIVRTEKLVETGHGPGVMAGRELVRFEIELVNGSSRRIDLNQVVVTTRYGSTRQVAAPVYTPSAGTFDFAGVLAPGGSTRASYGFAIPTSELRDVVMTVDFDGIHTSAEYIGQVSPR